MNRFSVWVWCADLHAHIDAVCVCVSYPGSFLPVGSREPREATWALWVQEMLWKSAGRFAQLAYFEYIQYDTEFMESEWKLVLTLPFIVLLWSLPNTSVYLSIEGGITLTLFQHGFLYKTETLPASTHGNIANSHPPGDQFAIQMRLRHNTESSASDFNLYKRWRDEKVTVRLGSGWQLTRSVAPHYELHWWH